METTTKWYIYKPYHKHKNIVENKKLANNETNQLYFKRVAVLIADFTLTLNCCAF